MLEPATYKEWTGAAWPGSLFEGEWKQGENIRFTGPDGSGTLATITELQPYQTVRAEHVAILQRGGLEDKTSEQAKGWIGTLENYTFIPQDDFTELKVDMETSPDWEKMFNDGWPVALARLKEICEEGA